MENYLAHFRTPGSRNGHRRYQDRNGRWTTEGKERRREQYALEFKKDSDGKYHYDTHYKRDKAVDALFEDGPKGKASVAEKAARSANAGVESTKKAVNAAFDLFEKRKQKRDYSKISDDELRKRINRMNLERAYSSLEDGDKKTGREYANEVLDLAGGITGVVSSAAVMGYAIYKLVKAVKN